MSILTRSAQSEIVGAPQAADETEDEAISRQFKAWLAKQNKELSAAAHVQGDGLPTPERAKQQSVVAEAKLRHWTKECEAAERALKSAQDEKAKYEQEVITWRGTFDDRLRVTMAELIISLKLFQDRLAVLQTQVDNDEGGPLNAEAGILQKEVTAVLQRIEILSRISTYGVKEIKIEPGHELPPEFQTQPGSAIQRLLAANLCANPHCQRSKIGWHPLCRNCQKAQAEGRINVAWARGEFSGERP